LQVTELPIFARD